jgi:uncharacterized repeat protein (TIGR03803 family)
LAQLALTTLATFNGNNGEDSLAGLIADAAGDLFGTTFNGGMYGDGTVGYGTVFEIKEGSYAVTTLAAFNGTNGEGPSANLIADAAGNLYGTTQYGGANDDGTVFEIKTGSGAITTLATFNGTDGRIPIGGLITDAAGDLFGTTSAGGAYGDGTVFEIKAGSGTVTTLLSFNGTDGSDPSAGLIADAAGDLFGTTYAGGANGDGTVFEVLTCPLPDPSI